jgi:hypothetical protein
MGGRTRETTVEWVVVRWDGDAPVEVCRRGTWAAADEARALERAVRLCRLTIEDSSSWEASRSSRGSGSAT